MKSPAVIVEFSIWPCSSNRFCFLYCKTQLLATYTFRTVMSSRGISPVIIMKCSSTVTTTKIDQMDFDDL